mmetsp:Transcript_5760/g.12565  ORF Transcript_5760/g.12565 Transcript_5760/m.12565 type:complete len:265 (+) Transcript_5760:509-1303(+)
MCHRPPENHAAPRKDALQLSKLRPSPEPIVVGFILHSLPAAPPSKRPAHRPHPQLHLARENLPLVLQRHRPLRPFPRSRRHLPLPLRPLPRHPPQPLQWLHGPPRLPHHPPHRHQSPRSAKSQIDHPGQFEPRPIRRAAHRGNGVEGADGAPVAHSSSHRHGVSVAFAAAAASASQRRVQRGDLRPVAVHHRTLRLRRQFRRSFSVGRGLFGGVEHLGRSEVSKVNFQFDEGSVFESDCDARRFESGGCGGRGGEAQVEEVAGE